MSLLRRTRRLTKAWRMWAERFWDEREETKELDGFGPSADLAVKAWNDFTCFAHPGRSAFAAMIEARDWARMRRSVAWSEVDDLDEDEGPSERTPCTEPALLAFCEAMRAGLLAARRLEVGEWGEYHGTINATLESWAELESVLEQGRPLAQLIDGLASDDPGLYARAAAHIADVGDRASEAIPTLVRHLSSRADPEPAMRALAEMGDAGIVALTKVIDDRASGFEAARRAVEVLERMGPRAVFALAIAVGHEHQEVARLAVDAINRLYSRVARHTRPDLVFSLGRHGGIALPILLRAIEDDDGAWDAALGVLDEVAGTLAKADAEVVARALEVMLAENRYWSRWKREPVVSVLIGLGALGRRVLIVEARANPEPDLLEALGYVTGWAKFSDAVEVFALALAHGSAAAHEAAFRCLADSGREAAPLLVNAVLDVAVEDDDVRRDALDHLRAIAGEPMELATVSRALEHEAPRIRAFALEVLSECELVVALPALCRGLLDPVEDVRRRAVRALVPHAEALIDLDEKDEHDARDALLLMLQDPGTTAALRRLVDDADDRVRVAARETIVHTATAAQVAALEQVHAIEDESARLAVILRALETPRIRAFGLEFLLGCELRSALPMLRRGLLDPDGDVRRRAVLALAPVAKALADLDDDEADARAALLLTLQDPATLGVLRRMAGGADDCVRVAARDVLGVLDGAQGA